MDRLRAELEENVALLSMLNPSWERLERDEDTDPHTDPRSREWHQCLDQLSWLMDHTPGGLSESSTAAEPNDPGCTFWLASNERSPNAIRHVQKVVRLLHEVASGDETVEAARDKIRSDSIKMSKKRVVFYAEQIACFARRCQQSRDGASGEDGLNGVIETILTSLDNHMRLCSLAFAFRGTQDSATLNSIISRSGRAPAFAGLRHYIGRLGSWHRAAVILTNAARGQPHLFRNATAKEILPDRIRTETATAISHGLNSLDKALRRILPAGANDRVRHVKESLQQLTDDDVTKTFLERLQQRSAKPCIHAEIKVLEQFYRRGLSFVNGDKYIGCSKPSCYCCHLYFKFHPSEPVLRSRHANTWLRWTFPVIDNGLGTWSERQDVMQLMVGQMRSDLLIDMSPTSNSIRRWLESTTAMSTTRSWMRRFPQRHTQGPTLRSMSMIEDWEILTM